MPTIQNRTPEKGASISITAAKSLLTAEGSHAALPFKYSVH